MPDLMLIPPIGYDTPEESRKGVNVKCILPSGVTEQMVTCAIIHHGWTLRARITWPEFFAREDRVRNQDNLQLGHAEANAMQQGVRQLRSVSITVLDSDWIIALPIQVEQRLDPNQVQVLATPNPKQPGQYICYFKARLRTEPLGYMSAASPAGIRFVDVSSPEPQPFPQPNFGAAGLRRRRRSSSSSRNLKLTLVAITGTALQISMTLSKSCNGCRAKQIQNCRETWIASMRLLGLVTTLPMTR